MRDFGISKYCNKCSKEIMVKGECYTITSPDDFCQCDNHNFIYIKKCKSCGGAIEKKFGDYHPICNPNHILADAKEVGNFDGEILNAKPVNTTKRRNSGVSQVQQGIDTHAENKETTVKTSGVPNLHETLPRRMTACWIYDEYGFDDKSYFVEVEEYDKLKKYTNILQDDYDKLSKDYNECQKELEELKAKSVRKTRFGIYNVAVEPLSNPKEVKKE